MTTDRKICDAKSKSSASEGTEGIDSRFQQIENGCSESHKKGKNGYKNGYLNSHASLKSYNALYEKAHHQVNVIQVSLIRNKK
jgi:hypothetical protein